MMLLLLEQVSQLHIHTTGVPQDSSCLVRTQDKVNHLQKTDFQSPGEKIHLMLLWFLRIISTLGSQDSAALARVASEDFRITDSYLKMVNYRLITDTFL